jgi:putative sigma-54 modulation protein
MPRDLTRGPDLKIRARNIAINRTTEDYIRRKFVRLERHLRPVSAADLEISKTSSKLAEDRIIAQLTIITDDRVLRGQERGATIRDAVDLVAAVLDRQIRRHKTRFSRTSVARRSARSAPTAEMLEALAMESEQEAAEERPAGTVIRTKRFPMTPMHVEDAIEEMEMLSHDFFLFHNLDSQEYNVLYRRRDGDYGLIQPKLIA